ncbi:hypothetical protein EG329_003951 [Mollisiaceae sp. DMI_Dod_QoI]|nr:hypothetical protein EG329_003951 [Helotiales sp. DMI_Dod_QoI]
MPRLCRSVLKSRRLRSCRLLVHTSCLDLNVSWKQIKLIKSFQAPLSSFPYKPLDSQRVTSIRVVILHKGSGNDAISCTIEHIQLGSRKYEALSYEWGQPSDDDLVIQIDGFGFKVRRNLFDALWHIRLPEEDRYVWIDAISINQDDLVERSEEVQKMGRIYRKASCVLVWVGLDAQRSDLAIDYFIQLAADARKREEDDPSRATSLQWKLLPVAKRQAIIAWLDRRYWKRLWIVQEIHLSQQLKIHCGKCILPGQDLYKVISAMLFDSMYDDSDASTAWNAEIKACAAVKLIGARMPKLPRCLSGWIQEFMASQCSEPIDVVFGLLGLCCDEDLSDNGKFNYAMTPAEVFRKVLELENTWLEDPGTFFYDFGNRLGLTRTDIVSIREEALSRRDNNYKEYASVL